MATSKASQLIDNAARLDHEKYSSSQCVVQGGWRVCAQRDLHFENAIFDVLDSYLPPK